MKKIEILIDRINEKKGVKKENFALLAEICREFDIEKVFLGIFFGKTNITEFFLLQSTYLKKWEEYYVKSRCYLYDPLFNCLGKVAFPFEWNVQQTKKDILLQQTLMQKAYEFGIHKGTTIPLLPHSDFQGFLTIINQVSLHPEILHALSLVANTCTDRIIKDKREEKLHSLTTREKEILLEKSHQSSIKSISRKLHVSESTIAFHLANIRKKLDTETTEHAIVKFLMHS